MTAAPPVVWFVVPHGFDDPQRVSGGNVFDQRVEAELRRMGWVVRPVEAAPDAPGDPFDGVPDDALVLVDGLVAIGASSAVEAAARRLRIAVLVHMVADAFEHADPRMVEGERAALSHAHRVIATSEWARDELVRRCLSPADRIVVATPGADTASPAAGTTTGGSLLCVGVVAPHKGQDTLIEALAGLAADPSWSCTIAGSVSADRSFAEKLETDAARAGLSERITWTGVLPPDDLDAAYARADVLIAPSRTESYGIAVGDALRRGIPVIASRVGGLPEAAQPEDAAILVPPGDPTALGFALRRWIEDPQLRARLSAAARRSAPDRPSWRETARTIDQTLAGLT
ncbi:glycosyltransferase family 4 protein [Microbacterium sp. CFH 31415]|uniref:glycosyltransferase family 4 protein n=1 Tax=Microbacterium sp. CFH 31415 TaxID=2921732 RepID=UPI001F12BFEA|nr:glycosyltransferase family 4 protein [Microbacterium sp. CFH 31415]MCH6230320.1 glycosyltransferase family 4 protein [Microbacterium sp. CFH 31415]